MINKTTKQNAHKELDHIFKKLMPAHGMKERQEQIRLSHAMLDTMFSSRIALSDAGTGIGKTYAYLAAAIVYSHSRQVDGLPFHPVIISTSSIALQNAIRNEYLPFLSAVLADDPYIATPVQAALRKGKNHYVCDKRLRQHLQQRPQKKHAAATEELHRMEELLDLDEAQHLSSFDREHICVPQFCTCERPYCRYRRFVTECSQKRYLFQICNHNLWLADCIHRKNGLPPILPDACAVIVDEAHKLPEAARQMFGVKLQAGEIRNVIMRLKQEQYELAADRLSTSASVLLQKMAELSPGSPIELLREDLRSVLSVLYIIQQKIGTDLSPATRRAMEQLTDKAALFLRKKKDSVDYTTVADDGRLMLCSVQLDLTEKMQSIVWQQELPMILTSGTLAIGGSFQRFQEEVGLAGNSRMTESVAISPFDYDANCRLYFPKTPPRLNDEKNYYQDTAGEITRLLYAANGHALVLFTSYKDMAAVCAYLTHTQTGIPVFIMRKNRPQVLEQFKSTPGAVLLATGAAWEGIDFPGDCVSLLIIPKLPFAFPDALKEHEKQRYTIKDCKRIIDRVLCPAG